MIPTNKAAASKCSVCHPVQEATAINLFRAHAGLELLERPKHAPFDLFLSRQRGTSLHSPCRRVGCPVGFVPSPRSSPRSTPRHPFPFLWRGPGVPNTTTTLVRPLT